jgi:hypothetical protein
MPLSWQNLLNSFYVNSPPLSVLKPQMAVFASFSAKRLKILNVSKVSDLSARK